MTEFVGPVSALAINGYACTVRDSDGTEIFSDGRVMVEMPKSRVQSSESLPLTSQPFASLLMKGGYGVRLDERDHLEVFEGSYFDEELMRPVSVKCHVSSVCAVQPCHMTEDGYVELGGSGIQVPRT